MWQGLFSNFGILDLVVCWLNEWVSFFWERKWDILNSFPISCNYTECWPVIAHLLCAWNFCKYYKLEITLVFFRDNNNCFHNCLLQDPRILLSAPRLYNIYKASTCQRNGRKKDLHASTIIEVDLFHKKVEVSSTYYPTQIWKTEGTHYKPSGYKLIAKEHLLRFYIFSLK